MLALAITLPILVLVVYQIWLRSSVPASAPLVALSADTTWHARLGLTMATYESALTRAGLRFVTVRPGTHDVNTLLSRVDGLVLSGGGDVAPKRYGGDAEALLVDTARDAFELDLIRGARERGTPILGICRGAQILNVAFGGTLRDLRGDRALAEAHGGELSGQHAHAVRISAGTRLAKIERKTLKRVNSFHGQAVARVGAGLRVAAVEIEDDTIEAIEAEEGFAIGVQWHPEILQATDRNELAIVRAFAEAARGYAAAKQQE